MVFYVPAALAFALVLPTHMHFHYMWRTSRATTHVARPIITMIDDDATRDSSEETQRELVTSIAELQAEFSMAAYVAELQANVARLQQEQQHQSYDDATRDLAPTSDVFMHMQHATTRDPAPPKDADPREASYRRFRERQRQQAAGVPMREWSKLADIKDERPDHVPVPPTPEQQAAADRLFQAMLTGSGPRTSYDRTGRNAYQRETGFGEGLDSLAADKSVEPDSVDEQ